MIVDLIGNAFKTQKCYDPGDEKPKGDEQCNFDDDYCEDDGINQRNEKENARIVWKDFANAHSSALLKSKSYPSSELSITIIEAALKDNYMREILSKLRPVFREIIEDNYDWRYPVVAARKIEEQDRILWENRQK